MMKTDSQIQTDVMAELKWEPFLNASEIGVAVKDGIVTLSGQVDSYLKKVAAEEAAKKISGVKAIAEDIQIGVSPTLKKTDTEIAAAVVNALKWHTAVQEEKIKIKVENGVVRLEGEVDWEYQRNNAKSAVASLAGVNGVINMIAVRPKLASSDINKRINEAFHRSATIDASRITAVIEGSEVTLHGKVRSYSEKEDAENAAWNAPGVIAVKNDFEIELPEYELEY